MTWGEAIRKTSGYLESKGVPEASLAAELLAARLLGVGRGLLAGSLAGEVSERCLEALRRGMQRLVAGEPVQYVLGEWDFRSLTLKCDSRALIPRPETEELVTRVLRFLPSICQSEQSVNPNNRTISPRPLYVIHQTGAKDEAEVIEAYSKVGLPSRVHAFEGEMANAFASADIVVARAGASTCFELAVCGKPALLIPLPTAMRNHQHFNADAFAAKGAADEGDQAKLAVRQVCRYLLEKYDNPDHLARMREKMKALATPDAAAQVADIIERGEAPVPSSK
mgnify:CR=1 FL=1